VFYSRSFASLRVRVSVTFSEFGCQASQTHTTAVLNVNYWSGMLAGQ